MEQKPVRQTEGNTARTFCFRSNCRLLFLLFGRLGLLFSICRHNGLKHALLSLELL
jgi:hypothetical protein